MVYIKIKPGITGLAQVEGRDSNSYEQKVDLDYTYLKNKNFFNEFKNTNKNNICSSFP